MKNLITYRMDVGQNLNWHHVEDDLRRNIQAAPNILRGLNVDLDCTKVRMDARTEVHAQKLRDIYALGIGELAVIVRLNGVTTRVKLPSPGAISRMGNKPTLADRIGANLINIIPYTAPESVARRGILTVPKRDGDIAASSFDPVAHNEEAKAREAMEKLWSNDPPLTVVDGTPFTVGGLLVRKDGTYESGIGDRGKMYVGTMVTAFGAHERSVGMTWNSQGKCVAPVEHPAFDIHLGDKSELAGLPKRFDPQTQLLQTVRGPVVKFTGHVTDKGDFVGSTQDPRDPGNPSINNWDPFGFPLWANAGDNKDYFLNMLVWKEDINTVLEFPEPSSVPDKGSPQERAITAAAEQAAADLPTAVPPETRDENAYQHLTGAATSGEAVTNQMFTPEMVENAKWSIWMDMLRPIYTKAGNLIKIRAIQSGGGQGEIAHGVIVSHPLLNGIRVVETPMSWDKYGRALLGPNCDTDQFDMLKTNDGMVPGVMYLDYTKPMRTVSGLVVRHELAVSNIEQTWQGARISAGRIDTFIWTRDGFVADALDDGMARGRFSGDAPGTDVARANIVYNPKT